MDTKQYVRWVRRHTRAIFIASAALVTAAALLAAFRLPLQSDLASLLPASSPSVKAAARLASRTPVRDTMLVVIVAFDAATREAAAEQMLHGIRGVDHDLVERAESDDAETREFVRAHRHLYVPLADLEAVRDALEQERARANPLYIDLEEDGGGLDELRARQHAAEAALARQPYVSADGRAQVIVVRTSFVATDVARDLALMAELDAIAARVRGAHPFVSIGFAGGPPVTLAEHAALSRGIVWSSVITAALVALVLFVHLRSRRMLALLGLNIVIATVLAFGAAALTVGHLNAATAFLGAIIAGNGVNYGILLVARYLEERRRAGVDDALALAVRGTLLPTLVASLGAAIAYGALAATKFRGFADFAWIGGVGMLICWVTSFVLLPALVMRFAPAVTREPAPLFGRAVVAVFGFRRPAIVCALVALVTVSAIVVSARYLTSDPYEYDLAQLRSRAPDALAQRSWLAYADRTFGRGLAGLGGQIFVAVERPDQVRGVVSQVRALSAREPLVGPASSVLDAIPSDQPAKLALLGEIRAQIDAVAPKLDDQERAELLALRPDDSLAAITVADLPHDLAAKLTERDGRVGTLIAVKPGARFDERDGHHLIRLASALHSLSSHDVTVAGAGLVFADVLTQIQADGPLVTGLAAIGIVVMVLLVVGPSRRALAVLAASGAGSICMVAVSSLAGLKINFLDFVALPITLGLGIDYAINVADRAARDPRAALRSTGGTVLVCSLTTMIGYASLLVSDNLAIRAFGLASLIGEVTCVIAALVVVPAIVALRAASRLPPRAAGASRRLHVFRSCSSV